MNFLQISVRINLFLSINKSKYFLAASNTAFIVAQMRAMENLTSVNNTQCIRFRPKNASDPYYITIFNGSGCYAPVSRKNTFIKITIYLIRLDLGVITLVFVLFH